MLTRDLSVAASLVQHSVDSVQCVYGTFFFQTVYALGETLPTVRLARLPCRVALDTTKLRFQISV